MRFRHGMMETELFFSELGDDYLDESEESRHSTCVLPSSCRFFFFSND